ncbi:uncharacterized protein LAESUDRAFT_813866 [Laetiporus sulphureus 93-53]|uniref:F-box domain-containing protein n=1 Tax=Laetiporus sulphureus 93-53 TaxID=1314785 RepID=A0A165DJE3_9APHY|nr:uncharacterized protein LAESUDRAFT_813866 [Laetiporus sulphureus 93-53]KZT05013.1 hypothetical protein LAESUDRAFT_813866 [Laetiporus sulphureus 93-53]
MNEEYRVMRVPFGLRRLWDQLAEEPSLASAVESLEIQRDDGLRYAKRDSVQVPRDYMEEAKDLLQDYHIISDANAVPHLRDIEKSLIRAIRHMSNLKRFKWDHVAPFIDARYDIDFSGDLWTALRSRETLRELEVMVEASDPGGQGGGIESEFGEKRHMRVHDSQIITLGQLTVFKYKAFGFVKLSESVSTDALTEMLVHRFPNLQELKLKLALHDNQKNVSRFTSTSLNTLLTFGNWPQLTSLSLDGAHMKPDALGNFLTRHKSLRSFRITGSHFLKMEDFPPGEDVAVVDKPIFVMDAFSELTLLDVPLYSIPWILSSPHTKPLALEDIGSLDEAHMNEDMFMMLRELPRLRTVRTVSYGADHLRALSCYVPGLQNIYGEYNQRSLARVVDALALFPQLEVVDRFYAYSPVSSDDEEAPRLLSQLGKECFRLRQFHGYDIVRTGDGEVVARKVRGYTY